MEDLKLPKAKLKPHKDRHLSMDEYLRFVMDNLKYTVDINAARRIKKEFFVRVPFVLR